MHQLLQHLGNGTTSLIDVPAPGPNPGRVLVQTSRSLVSAGTERMLLDFGKAGWIGKARQQPEKVRAAVNKIRSDGLLVTWQAVRSKLDQPIPLGYCNVGVVVDAGHAEKTEIAKRTEPRDGDGHAEFSRGPVAERKGAANGCPSGDEQHKAEIGLSVGDRVVSNSPHAEVVTVSPLLCAKIPDAVADDTATFTPLAAIALEGIALLNVAAGDWVVVTGLGLIGQLAVQILRAQGCRVLGFDPAADRRALAAKHGAELSQEGENPVTAALRWSNGQGVAGVLITASAASNDLVNNAARSCRFRGKVVLVGVVGLQLNRADFYRNEVSFQVSCSYGRRDSEGPGSAKANFIRVLEWMARGDLVVRDLITHRFGFANAPDAYAALGDRSSLGIVLEYGENVKSKEPGQESGRRKAESGAIWAGADDRLRERTISLRSSLDPNGYCVGVIGAGNFAVRTLLPAIAKLPKPPRIAAMVSNQGVSAVLAAKKFGAARASTDEANIIGDSTIQAVFITTRHNLHTRQVIDALRAGKHVWVEKPLALNYEDVETVAATARSAGKRLMVGFNRRYAPFAVLLRDALCSQGAVCRIEITVNAGRLEPDHWTLDKTSGGGRIVGEGCHFVDLARFLARSAIKKASCLRRDSDGQDGGRFELGFANGACAVIDYRTDLPSHWPKETIAVSGDGFSATILNWKELSVRGMRGLASRKVRFGPPPKGHAQALHAFFQAIDSGVDPQLLDELVEVSRLAIALQMMRTGESVNAASGRLAS